MPGALAVRSFRGLSGRPRRVGAREPVSRTMSASTTVDEASPIGTYLRTLTVPSGSWPGRGWHE
jgi:hypothetical protein